MISKESFVKQMSLIQNYYSEIETLQVLIDKITDGYSIVTIGEHLISGLLDFIEEDFGLDKEDDLLGWWLYEDVDKIIYNKDGSVLCNVRTPDELYDYIISSKLGEGEY